MSLAWSGSPMIRVSRLLPHAGLIAVCLAVVAPEVLAQAPAVGAEKIARMRALAVAQLDSAGLPSVSIALGVGDRIVWSDAFGYADVEYAAPADVNTLYRTASISKWMTATAAMSLVESGELDLDAPVQAYCPRYPEKRWTLTTRHLLTHRGGVRHYVGANGEDPQAPEARAELAERRRLERSRFLNRYMNVVAAIDGFKDDSLLFEPGARFQYTSLGYRLVGCILEGAGKGTYTDVMEARVFGPAEMTHTVTDDLWEIIPGRARFYLKPENGELRNDSFRDVTENLPAGGHLSTPTDLVRFALAWDRGDLVSAASTTRMTAAPDFPNAVEPPDSDQYYGYGIGVRTADGRNILSHSGGQNGTTTFLTLLPDQDLAIAVMTNTRGQSQFVGSLLRQLADIALED